MKNTTQRVAIVTGANRGLGKEVGRQLAEQGDIVIVTARQLSSAQQTVEELGLDNLLAAQLDITNQESVDQLVELSLIHI